MKKYETIIFDLDGTLLDTLEDLKDSVNYALGEAGLPERSLDEIRRSVGERGQAADGTGDTGRGGKSGF